jgi:peroxiredoxin
MSLTPTTQIPLGFKAPDFTLFDTVSQKEVSLSQLASDKGTVVMFICNHCPYVKHVIEGIIAMANDYIPKGITFIAISSNDAGNYPDDSPEKMREEASRLKFPFPYLYDETQEVAKLYSAACTPDFNIFNADLECVYRGQMDDSRPGNSIPVTGKDMRAALDAIISGNEVSRQQTPSVGCNIKWK